jgi:hypothetical protein
LEGTLDADALSGGGCTIWPPLWENKKWSECDT